MVKIARSEMTVMPWKNGGGSTFEIAIDPVGATLAKSDFNWRVSVAEVHRPGPFSKFPGFSRILTVWSGKSLILNESGSGSIRMLPFEPLAFRGEIQIDCVPDGVIEDFGIIFSPDFVSASVRLIDSATFEVARGRHFLLATSSGFSIGSETFERGDVLDLVVEKNVSFEVQWASPADRRALLLSIVQLAGKGF